MTPRRLFAVFAAAEVVTWTLLIVGMVLKYVTHTTELGVRIGGGIHGFVFLGYVLVTLAVAVDRRWSPGTTLAGLASAVIPYATVPFERSAERRGLLEGDWQVREGREPRTAAERLVGWAVRNTALAAVLALLAVAALFGVLLWLGPPVPQR